MKSAPLIAMWLRLRPRDLHSGSVRVAVQAILHALVLVAFGWNQIYVPLHLAAHRHLAAEISPSADPGAGHLHADDHTHSDHSHSHFPEGSGHSDEPAKHEPHPAADHLFGYFAQQITVTPPDLLWFRVATLALGETPPLPGRVQFARSIRGPPSLLQA